MCLAPVLSGDVPRAEPYGTRRGHQRTKISPSLSRFRDLTASCPPVRTVQTFTSLLHDAGAVPGPIEQLVTNLGKRFDAPRALRISVAFFPPSFPGHGSGIGRYVSQKGILSQGGQRYWNLRDAQPFMPCVLVSHVRCSRAIMPHFEPKYYISWTITARPPLCTGFCALPCER
jgi:hypothetical protein